MEYQRIISFWFEQSEAKDWFQKNSQYDQKIIELFSDVHRAASMGELVDWRNSALGALAEIIVLDQFSRNMFRDQARAFAYDGMALILSQEAIAQNKHAGLSATQKAFLYMPFMHSESKAIHQRAVELFSEPGLENNLDFELKHKKIIDRFGRYPHRNKLLNRTSTAEEIDFLKQPGSSF